MLHPPSSPSHVACGTGTTGHKLSLAILLLLGFAGILVLVFVKPINPRTRLLVSLLALSPSPFPSFGFLLDLVGSLLPILPASFPRPPKLGLAVVIVLVLLFPSRNALVVTILVPPGSVMIVIVPMVSIVSVVSVVSMVSIVSIVPTIVVVAAALLPVMPLLRCRSRLRPIGPAKRLGL